MVDFDVSIRVKCIWSYSDTHIVTYYLLTPEFVCVFDDASHDYLFNCVDRATKLGAGQMRFCIFFSDWSSVLSVNLRNRPLKWQQGCIYSKHSMRKIIFL